MLTTDKIIEMALEAVPDGHKVMVGQRLIQIAETAENKSSGHGEFVEAIASFDFDRAKRKTNTVFDSQYLHLYCTFRNIIE